jgi:hypothetical protein
MNSYIHRVLHAFGRLDIALPSGLLRDAYHVHKILGTPPQLRVIEGGQRDVRQPLDEATLEKAKNVASA